MGRITELGTAFVDRKIPAGLNAIGSASVEHIRADISTPYPPSSAPGAPPHLREGKLAAGLEYEVGGDKVTIRSTRVDEMVPVWLEGGTSRMAARPYMTPAKFNTTRIAGPAMKEAMKA